jgi:hypothetical protein
MVANRPVLHKVEVSWDDALHGNFPDTSVQQLFTQTVIAVAAQAKAVLLEANCRVERARDLVLGGAVMHNDNGSFTVRSQSRSGKRYTVDGNGTCHCPDAAQGQEPCKHLLATWIWRKAHRQLERQLASHGHGQHSVERSEGLTAAVEADFSAAAAKINVDSTADALPAAPIPGIPTQFVVVLHGK